MGDQSGPGRIGYEEPGWKPIRPGTDIHDSIPADAKTGIGWMRLRFRVSEDARKQKLAMMIKQSVASEIYLNGQMIYRLEVGLVINFGSKNLTFRRLVL